MAFSFVQDIKTINTIELSSPYFFSSHAWASIKAQFGWETIAFRQQRYPEFCSDMLILLKKIPLLGYFAYIPDSLLPLHYDTKHPLPQHITRDKNTILKIIDLFQDITKLIDREHKKKICALQWDIPWIHKTSHQTELKKQLHYILQKNTSILHKGGNAILCNSVQPPSTVILSLNASKKDILHTMKQKTRYNIRLAQKKGVEVKRNIPIKDFYALYKLTSQRNNITIHSEEYYKTVIQTNKNNIQIYGAYYKKELIASIIVCYYYNPQKKSSYAIYLYGASSNAHRNVMAAYLLQWSAITDALLKGCTHYDFFGIDMASQSSMKGLYQFKTGFGNKVYTRPCGIYYFPNTLYSSITTLLFVFAQKIRYWYYHTLKKRH